MGDCLHFFGAWSKWIFCASFELKNELGASCERHRDESRTACVLRMQSPADLAVLQRRSAWILRRAVLQRRSASILRRVGQAQHKAKLSDLGLRDSDPAERMEKSMHPALRPGKG